MCVCVCVCVCVRARARGKEPFILPLGSVCVCSCRRVYMCIWCGTWVFSVCACMSACVCLCLSRSVTVSIYVTPAPAWNNDTIIVNRPSPSSVDCHVYEVTPCSEINDRSRDTGSTLAEQTPDPPYCPCHTYSLFSRFSRAVCLCMGFVRSGLGWLSLAVLHWVVSRSLAGRFFWVYRSEKPGKARSNPLLNAIL